MKTETMYPSAVMTTALRAMEPTPEETAAAEKAKAEAEAKAKADAEAKAKEEAERAKNGGKPTDAEAKLLKEVMDKKTKLEAAEKKAADAEARLKAFEGIDPAKVKELLDAQAKAEAERKKAEEEQLAKKGEWDRLKAQMAEENGKVVKQVEERASKAEQQVGTLQQQIADLTVGGAFSNSPFIKDEMALTSSKARVVYGSHFEFQGGKVVAFDKPAGAKDRTMLVDSKGEPLGFEDSIKKIVEADPEKDHLLKSKARPGAGSGTLPGGKRKEEESAEISGRGKIAAGLAAQAKAKK
jgi:hypothetical protein